MTTPAKPVISNLEDDGSRHAYCWVTCRDCTKESDVYRAESHHPANWMRDHKLETTHCRYYYHTFVRSVVDFPVEETTSREPTTAERQA